MYVASQTLAQYIKLVTMLHIFDHVETLVRDPSTSQPHITKMVNILNKVIAALAAWAQINAYLEFTVFAVLGSID